MISIVEGICPKCSTRYYGWALTSSIQQKCEKCGADLDVYKNGVLISSGQSPIDKTATKNSNDRPGYNEKILLN